MKLYFFVQSGNEVPKCNFDVKGAALKGAFLALIKAVLVIFSFSSPVRVNWQKVDCFDADSGKTFILRINTNTQRWSLSRLHKILCSFFAH